MIGLELTLSDVIGMMFILIGFVGLLFAIVFGLFRRPRDSHKSKESKKYINSMISVSVFLILVVGLGVFFLLQPWIDMVL